MTIVVTGASGFLGLPIIRALAAIGHIGIAASRREVRNLPLGWTWTPRDVLLRGRGLIGGLDALIHLEVKQHVPSPMPKDVAEFEEVNVQGTAEWLKWCGDREIRRVIYFSSIKAVGDSTAVQDELATASPATPYGYSKRKAEDSIAAWAAHKPSRQATILRPAVIYGPGNGANIFSMVDAIHRRRFFLIGANNNVKSLVSIENIAAAAAFFVQRRCAGCEIFNVTDRDSYSVREVAFMVASSLGRHSGVPSLPLPAAKAVALLGSAIERLTRRQFPLNPSRLKAMTETTHFTCRKLLDAGFIHPQTTQEGLGEMVEWYKGISAP